MTSARQRGAVLGVISASAGLAVSELASGVLHQRVSPLVAVGETIIRLTPGSVIELVISLVGRNDKPLLIALTIAGMFAISAFAGVLSQRSLMAAEAVFLAMGLVLLLAVRERLTPSTGTYIPALLGVGTAIVALAALARYAWPAPPDAGRANDADEPSRRSFLYLAVAVATGAVVAGATGRLLAHGRAALDSARRRLSLPVTVPTEPAGVDVAVNGIEPWMTAQEDFYRIDTALSIPQILPDEWQLRIHGMVDREMTLTYDDLLQRDVTEDWLTLCCVSNAVGGDLISNAWFSGVRIADLLAEAGIQEGADAVLSRSDDDWTCGTPLGALTDDRNALLAVAMNGEPLTPEHGFPVRMVVPGLYGYVSATKWVVDMEVTRFDDFSAFWTDRGWSAEGPIKTQSRIDVPADGANLSAGKTAIGGVAWSQHTGIAKVEVKIDDAGWVEATLGAEPSTDSWRQWSYVWQADSGGHQLQVRATDESGYTQTEEIADVVPDGATGWHTINVDVR